MLDLEPLIKAYFKLLNSIDWDDEILVSGLREGLNKFPSNAFLKMHTKNKYLCGDYYSSSALKQVKSKQFSNLIFEHMVPKSKYIQKPCEKAAIEGKLNLDFMRNLFQRYWKIAVITKSENSLLHVTQMPKNWDSNDYLARYKESGIKLIKSPYNH